MEKETRSAVERAAQKARRLLEQEFAEQLAGVFGILQDGRIDEEASGRLSDKQYVQRQIILAAISHKRSSGMQPAESIADYIRDAAFTTLNRFSALKMLECRGLVQECVSNGDASQGYIEFTSFAPGLKMLNGGGYRLYIESVFDELSTEIKVLFDRWDPAGSLWPRKNSFDALLDAINAAELVDAWEQDETIGWIYQYFNSAEERREMREASQAPRNSRELAIRNQFFTPNYVVRFLVDNTLGRIWYEMRQGSTRLAQECTYMIRRPGETFAGEDEIELGDEILEGLSQQEMWQRPIRVPHRAKKDPRAIGVLDPACGSGHFLLGAFDLLVTIYVEAWSDPKSPSFHETGLTLREDYPDIVALRRSIPGLVLRHNLHGVDIDPRCGQIAQLALWMRAQRKYADASIIRSERPRILRSNIVIAEPMPGDIDVLDDFVLDLNEDRLEAALRRVINVGPEAKVRATKAMADSLASLIRAIWQATRLAGELGLLLRIEKHLSKAVEQGRAEWENQLPLFRATEYGLDDAPLKQNQSALNPVDDRDFWSKAERLVLQALKDHAWAAGFARRRLFAEDAAQGFALAEMAAKSFDVVLMNPPFGACSLAAKTEFEQAYPRTKNDVYAAFVERGVEMLHPRGRLGAITSRTGFFITSFQKWREELLLKQAPVIVFADLGAGVLDAAMVETAAFCLENAQ